MTRHRRLQRTMRSPQRQARTWRNRSNRQLRIALREMVTTLRGARNG
jgi:hypothetical protein